MEVAAAVQSVSSSLPSFFHARLITKTSNVSNSIESFAFKRSSLCHQPQIHRTTPLLALSSVSSQQADASATDDIWLLEPIGDGDWKHIGFKVQRPGSYQILSSSVTVGRVPDKADLVIPVATVSGLHARFEKRQGDLYLTDLGSTNGTYVNERRLRPGEVFPVLPGNRVTFDKMASLKAEKPAGSQQPAPAQVKKVAPAPKSKPAPKTEQKTQPKKKASATKTAAKK